MKLLPYEFNTQDLNRRESLMDHMPYINLGYVYHFNAIPNNSNNSQTIYWMEKTFNALYK